MYESRKTAPLPRSAFVRRLLLHFAGAFALYSGLVFLIGAGLMLAPVLHRMLHRFHWEDRER